MDEKYFKDKISGYFDGDLKPEEMAMMTEWLKNSPEGQQALAELGRLDEFVRRESELGGSEDFWEAQARKIEARLGFESAAERVVTDIRPKKSSGLAWKMVAAAASVVLLIYVGVNRDDIFGPDKLTTRPPAVSKDMPEGESQPETGRSNELLDDSVGVQREEIGSATTTARPDVQQGKKETAVAQPEMPLPGEPPAAIPSPTLDIRGGRAAEVSIPMTETRQGAPSSNTAGQEETKADAVAPQKTETDLSKSLEVIAETTEPAARPEVQGLAHEATRAAVADEFGADTMLAVWRQTLARTDSTLNTMNKAKSGQQLPDLKTTMRSKAAPATTSEPKIDRAKVEAELLEAAFNIAQASPDSAEQAVMKDRLAAVAADPDSPNRKLAQSYLDRLPTRK